MPFKGCRVLSLPDEKLLALLPVAVLPQLVLDEPVESAVVEYEGTLVFVDVSGFSSVACRLQQFTDDGAEQLSFHLNRYFAQLIAVVKRHHGDIIFFSGDAMMVAWSGVAPGDAAAMSILCGDALLAETGRYSFSIDADGGPPVVCSMSLHIGGASGKFAGLTVGGKGAPESGQWKFLVTGEPVELAGIAAASGADGELVVSSDLARLAREAGLAVETAALSMVQDIKKSTNSPSMEVFVSSVAKTELKRTLLGLPFPSVTCHPTPLPAHAKEKAALFVWDTVIQAAESLQSHGELRTVSTVFIKFVSIDSRLPPAELQAQIDAALGEVQKELAKVGGVLNKVVLDDKGLICLCLFGIPLHGHESDAYRALQFSLKAGKKMIKACSCVTAIGISRAVVFCGMTGSDQRNEYTVLGDGVNIAARLMMKAEQFRPGKRHIIIDEDTAAGKDVQKVSCHGHAIVEGDSLLLKGQDRPIMCYHVVNECDRAYAVARVQNGETDLPSPGSSLSSGSSMYSMSSASSVATRKSTLSHASKRSATAHLLNRERDVPKKARVAGKPGKYLGTIAKGALAPDDDDDEEAALYEDAIPHGIGVDKASSFRGVVRLRRSQRGSLASSEEDDDNLSVVSSGGLDFVGREVELDAVSRTVMDWARGQTADKSVILAGEARIGKTRLLAVATDRIKLPVVTLACSEASQRDQYGALSPVILRLSLETAIAKQPRLGELQQHLPLLHHIVRIAAVPLPGLELTTLAPREKEAKTNAVVLGLLKAQYGSPLVLVVDDLQWLDEASASFVADAFEQPWVFVLGAIRIDLLRRECMVSSCRSSCANGSVDSSDAMLPIPLSVGNGVNRVQTLLVGAPQTRTIAVLPFCVRMTSEIVKRVLGCQAVEPTLAQLLHEKSDGLPGCLVELLGNLREEGHVLVDLTGKAIRNLTADESSMVFDRSVMEASIMTIVDRYGDSAKKSSTAAAQKNSKLESVGSCV
ncbi:Adenylate cyclase 2 [Diplonema papillatum]|nr:Adenylate cyclase 2 [Diplonema papillatum]